jgi:hypothetical protein
MSSKPIRPALHTAGSVVTFAFVIDELLPLLGKSLESPEIKDLFSAWNAPFPKKITCTANNDRVKTKLRKDGIELEFGRGGYSKYKKPIPASRKGSYVGMLNLIVITPTYPGPLPFPVSPAVDPDELTRVLGKPKVVEFMGTTTTWRSTFANKYELVASVTASTDGTSLNVMHVNHIFEPDLYTDEDYKAAGL